VVRQKDGDEQRTQTDEPPLKKDIRSFRREVEENREADRKIKEPPQHIDERRGFADARRRCERALEPMAADSLDEMRNPIGEKQSGDELKQINVSGKI
jgi:hypothetical protein